MVLWFGLKKQIQDVQDQLDEIYDAIKQNSGKIEQTDAFDSLPDDPNTLQKILMARRLKRRIISDERNALLRLGKPPPRWTARARDEAELAEKGTEPDIEQMKDLWSQVPAFARPFISNWVKTKTGYDIDALLANAPLLAQVLQQYGGALVQKGKEAIAEAQTQERKLVIEPYDPSKGPTG